MTNKYTPYAKTKRHQIFLFSRYHYVLLTVRINYLYVYSLLICSIKIQTEMLICLSSLYTLFCSAIFKFKGLGILASVFEITASVKRMIGSYDFSRIVR